MTRTVYPLLYDVIRVTWFGKYLNILYVVLICFVSKETLSSVKTKLRKRLKYTKFTKFHQKKIFTR